MTQLAGRSLLALLVVGCASAGGAPASPAVAGAPRAGLPATLPTTTRPCEYGAGASPGASATATAPPLVSPSESRLDLELARTTLELPAGRWVVRVEAPAKSYVTIGLAGPRDALERFEVLSRKLTRLQTGTEDDDGRLPAFVSFENQKQKDILVVVDAKEPVRVLRTAAPLFAPNAADAQANTLLPLVGLPFPIERRAGYLLQAPHRYQFARADVVSALRTAFLQTSRRFQRNAIAVGDISQWNGIRPATDLGKARHISHQGGRDVDIGLPAQKGASLLTRRCEGVLVENDELRCGPGTVKGLDGMRLAYFLGLLLDGPTPQGRYVPDKKRRPGPIAVVQTIFTDQAYIDEIRKALPELRSKRWIHDEAYSALAEEGLLRPSPWHVDHVHIRFAGKPAETPPPLAFPGEP